MTRTVQFCPPGASYRHPHNHELCMRYWPEEARRQWEDQRYPLQVLRAGGVLKYKLLSEHARAPRRGMAGDAGLDLTAVETVRLPVAQFRRVNLDVAIQLPEWAGCLMMARSSTVGRGILVLGTVIDAGYRGELFCMAFNLTAESQVIEAGTRVAQIVPFEAVGAELELVEVEELDPSERGHNGFGSTGL